ncbi:MAG: hypothetical protein ACYDG6_01920 [Thermincolia bacterium]
MGKRLILVTAVVIALAAGFVAGQQVQAATGEPGSVTDPLVSESYVKAEVEKQVNLLQAKVKELQAKADVLQAKVEELEKQK